MKVNTTRRLLLIIVVLLILIVAVSLGFGMLIAFLEDKSSLAWLIIPFIMVVIAGWAYSIRNTIRDKKINAAKSSEYLNIGRLIFKNNKEEFDSFYNLFLTDRKKFLSENEVLLRDYIGSEQKVTPFDVLYIFAEAKKLVSQIDWRGEENEQEIEGFLGELLGQKHTWTNSSKLRIGVDEDKQRDGEFIIDLFKALDKDLQAINQRLIFFNLGGDSYVFTTVDSKAFDEIISKSGNDFLGADVLR